MDLFAAFSGSLLGILLFGCFVQVITILSLIRYGLGLTGFDVGLVSFVLALVLSLLMIESKFGLNSSLEKTVSGSPIVFSEVIESKVKPFLIEASDPLISQRVSQLANSIASSNKQNSESTTTSLAQLEATFLLSQLKRALTIGLILLMPLLVIDIMVAITLTVVGVQTIPAAVVAIPLKLLLFVIIDGWSLIVNKLLIGFI